jgi:hypothetical protein
MFNFKMLIYVFLVVSGKCLFLQMFKNDETTVYPGVVIKSSELDVSSSQVDIKIFCNRTMLCCAQDLEASLLACYCSYYVFDIKYNPTLQNFFTFLDHVCNCNVK